MIRVGLHVGEPVRDDDDYFGTAVVVARRLCDMAEGGQILASELMRGLGRPATRARLPAPRSAAAEGPAGARHRLRGVVGHIS